MLQPQKLEKEKFYEFRTFFGDITLKYSQYSGNTVWCRLLNKDMKELCCMNDVCFASVREKIKSLWGYNEKRPKYLEYRFNIPHKEDTLDSIRFLELGKQNNILDENLDTESVVEEGKFTVSLDDRSSVRVYRQLSYVRAIDEFRGLAQNVVNLVYNHGVSFWPAFYYSSFISCKNTNHHFVFLSSIYSYVSTN